MDEKKGEIKLLKRIVLVLSGHVIRISARLKDQIGEKWDSEFRAQLNELLRKMEE